MHPIIYDVAVSLDGFIAGPSGDVSKFTYEGEVVDDYHARMAEYRTAIMGRVTYEFGYQFGIEPGQNPYKHMRTIVFSKTLECPAGSEIEILRNVDLESVNNLKTTSKGPIYLSGGGAFAGILLKMGVIDEVRLKRTPIVLGSGIQLFGQASGFSRLTSCDVKLYESGHVLESLRA